MTSKPSVPESTTVITASPVADPPSAEPHQPISRIEQHLSIFSHRIASLEAPVSRSQSSLPVPASLLPNGSRHNTRNGKIARLPKLYRDLVSRLLQNNVPQEKIVAALDQEGIVVTQRNISNWRTRGGYKEWCLEQERQLQLSMMQDNLTDYLRKNDATQLPEVGLQVAATQLSSMLLNPEAVQQLTAEPEKYSKVVDMLCRLSTHIQSLQKDRNEAVRKAGIRDTSEQLRRHEEEALEKVRWETSADMCKDFSRGHVPHRNELPKRDALPYRELPPIMPSTSQMMEQRMMEKLGLRLRLPGAEPFENPGPEKPPLPPTPPASNDAGKSTASPSPIEN